MATMYLILIAVMATFLVSARGTKYTDCGSTTGEVQSVAVTDCPDSDDVCTLTRGTDAAITIGFTAKADSTTVKAVVHGIIATVPIPFSIPKPDGCKCGISCPVKNGQTYSYNNSLSIRNSYPPVSVTIKWELKDDKSNDMVCVEIPAKLV